jgi:trehalose transport system substrate-binding protein
MSFQSMRVLKVLICLSVFLLLMVACSSETTVKEDSKIQSISQNDSKETRLDFSGTTLEVAFGLGETEWKVFREKILPAFKLQTGITVKPIESRESLVSLLTNNGNSNTSQVDMFTIDVNNLSEIVSQDLVLDLTGYKDIVPETVVQPMVDASTFNGDLLFLPFRPNVEVAFYNEEKFKQYGITPPANWNELLVVAKELKEKTGEGRIAIKANLMADNILHLFDFIRQAGGDPYNLSDKGTMEAFSFLQELYPYLSTNSTTANWNTMNKYLEDETVYLGQNWPFYIPEFHKNGNDQIKAYSGWKGPEKNSHVLGGDVIGIPKGSQNKQAALLLAEYLISKPVQEVLAKKLAWPSVRYDSYGIIEGYQKPYFNTIKDILKTTDPRGNKSYWKDAEPLYVEAFQRIVIKGENVEAVLNELSPKFNKLKQS